jgi:hypothetical protein
VAYERAALATLHRAFAMSKTPLERAKTIDMVGVIQELWGFPYDAYLSYGAAVRADPTLVDAQRDYARFSANHVEPIPASRER